MFALLLTLFTTITQDDITVDNFDKAEINHFYDDQGRHVFDQVLWSDWVGNDHRIEAWRLVKSPNVYPKLNRETGKYESIFHDNDLLRKVIAKSLVESWTQYDPELVGRESWPKEKRRDLQIRGGKPKDKPVTVDFNQIWRMLLP